MPYETVDTVALIGLSEEVQSLALLPLLPYHLWSHHDARQESR